MDRPQQPVAQPTGKKDTPANVEDSATRTQVTSEKQPGDAVEDTPTKETPTDDTPSEPIAGSVKQGPDEEGTEDGKDKLESSAMEVKEKEDVGKVMAKLTRFIYNYPGYDLGPIKTRAILCHIYYLAINDKWFQARDLMLMSHLQEGIQFADVPTQVSRVEQVLFLLVVSSLCMCTGIPKHDA